MCNNLILLNEIENDIKWNHISASYQPPCSQHQPLKKINIGRPQVDCTVHTVYVSSLKKLTQPLKNSYDAKQRLLKSTNWTCSISPHLQSTEMIYLCQIQAVKMTITCIQFPPMCLHSEVSSARENTAVCSSSVINRR